MSEPYRMTEEDAGGLEDLERQHGQEILDILYAHKNQGVDPLFEALNRGYEARQANQAKADE